MKKNIYRESTIYENFVYPRYVSELDGFKFKPIYKPYDFDVDYAESFLAHHREDELWYQKDKLAQMIVADNDLAIKDADDKLVYIADCETYIPTAEDTDNVYYLNELLDDEACWIHMACGTWIGNTNRNERITEMKSTDVNESWHSETIADSEEYTVSLKRIWGFEPDKAESSSDISKGIIDGFSKKYYSVLVKKDGEKNVYIPTVNGTPLTDTQIANIISTSGTGETREGYPTDDGNLLVSD